MEDETPRFRPGLTVSPMNPATSQSKSAAQVKAEMTAPGSPSVVAQYGIAIGSDLPRASGAEVPVSFPGDQQKPGVKRDPRGDGSGRWNGFDQFSGTWAES
jgi:hypothetical protein